jgi:DNA-binding response OmpR family regulator
MMRTRAGRDLITPGFKIMSDDNKQIRVLVVDDQPRIIRFIEIYLRLKGFDVISATCGLEALELARSKAPDIMLLDIVMPDMDGFEVMRNLRHFSRIPVIAISASPGSYSDAKEMGCNDFISKPFQTDEVLTRINRLLDLQPG